MKRLEEYPLGMFDTPILIRFQVQGGEVNPVGVVVRDNEMFLQIEVTGTNQIEYDIFVEVHGTEWPIPNAEDAKYVGTGTVYGFVWHVFCTIQAASIENMEERTSDKHRIYTIYKYPVEDNGEVAIETEHRIARVLHRGIQYDRHVA